ncbi:outer membrane beta-barrel protein [candidate division KSB1 bacterium]|nr:outer membrane beta-barrel protein [candidate division KSB1 bacterium]
MKRNYFIMLMVGLFCLSSTLMAQNSKLTFGLLSSHFHNYNSDQRLTEIKNPFGYGLVLGYQLNEHLSLGFTGEYFNGTIESNLGDASHFRGNFSFFIFPFSQKLVNPYFSSGVVYNYQKLEYNQLADETKDRLHLRTGLGLDFAITPVIHLNFDTSIQSDGMNFVGNVNSFGVRYVF